MKKLVSVLCILILIISLASCGQKETEKEFCQLVTDINKNNKSRNAPARIPAHYYYTPDEKVALFENETFLPVNETKEKLFIEKADIETELNWLLRLLRTYYCGYGKFGGDKAFEAAIQNILDDISSNSSISNMDYQELLARHFAFVQDNHFLIGSKSKIEGILYGKEDLPFYKKSGRFYSDASFRTEVLSINGESPEHILKPSVSLEGELVYLPYMKLLDSTTSPEIEVEYNNSEKTSYTLTATDYHPVRDDTCPEILTKTQHNGITSYIYEHFSEKESESAIEFINTAAKIKTEPAVIYDLSLNSGGHPDVLKEWFSSYTGEDLMPNTSRLIRKNFFDIQTNEDIAKEYAEQTEEMKRANAVEDDSYYSVLSGRQYLEPDTAPLLIVLTSSHTGSCGEYMTDACRNISNTIVIGGYTSGSLSGNMSSTFFTLPYSGVAFNFGNEMFIWEEDYFQEAIGFAPDIFLTGPDCEKRLEMFLEKLRFN